MTDRRPQRHISKLTATQKEYIASLEGSRSGEWLKLYISGCELTSIAEKYGRPISQVEFEITKHRRQLRALAGQRSGTEITSRGAVYPKYENKNRRRLFERLKKRVDEQFDKKFYIGDICVSAEEYDELLNYIKFQLRNISGSSSALGDSPLLAVALVQIGIREYDGSYWEHAFKTMGIANQQRYQTFLGRSFINTLKKHNKYILDESNRVQSILVHTFVSDYYSKGLFEILFQYYSRDLERDIRRNDSEQMQALMETFAREANLSEKESEAFTGQFTKSCTSQAYKLKQHTLQAISANERHSYMRLRHLLRLIDRAFWEGSVPKKPVSRLTIRFKAWTEESDSFKSEYRLYEKGEIQSKGKKHFSSPYLFADIKNTSFILKLPSQIIRTEDPGKVCWRISTRSKQKELMASIYPVLTGVKTDECQLEISREDLFDSISCTLICEKVPGKRFAEIPASMIRLFDLEGDFAQRLFKIPMCAYMRSGGELHSSAYVDHVVIGDMTRWDFDFLPGDVLILPDKTSMIVGQKFVEGFLPRNLVPGAAYHSGDGREIPVYSALPELLLTMTPSKRAGTILDVNGKRYCLDDCESFDFEYADSHGQQAFCIPMKQFFGFINDGYNTVILDMPGVTYAKKFDFVFVQQLKLDFEGSPYIFDERGTLVLPQGMSVKCSDPTAEKIPGENGFQFELAGRLTHLPIEINKTILINCVIPVLQWSTDEETWHCEPMGEIWHTKFEKYPYIFFRSPISKFSLCMDDDFDEDGESDQRSVVAETLSNGRYRIDMTRFRTWITREKVAHRIFLHINHKLFLFAVVYAKSFVSACGLTADYDAGALEFSGNIIGESEYYVDIINENTNRTIAEKAVLTNGKVCLSDRLQNGAYRVEIFEKEEEESFFDDPMFFSLYSFSTTLINKNDLSGRSICLTSVRPRALSALYAKFQKKIWVTGLIQIAPRTYEGEICEKDSNTKVRLKVEDDSLRYYSLLFWDEYDNDYLEFIYDSQKRCLVKEEEPGLRPSEKYRRYKMLYESDMFFYGSVEDRKNPEES